MTNETTLTGACRICGCKAADHLGEWLVCAQCYPTKGGMEGNVGSRTPTQYEIAILLTDRAERLNDVR